MEEKTVRRTEFYGKGENDKRTEVIVIWHNGQITMSGRPQLRISVYDAETGRRLNRPKRVDLKSVPDFGTMSEAAFRAKCIPIIREIFSEIRLDEEPV